MSLPFTLLGSDPVSGVLIHASLHLYSVTQMTHLIDLLSVKKPDALFMSFYTQKVQILQVKCFVEVGVGLVSPVSFMMGYSSFLFPFLYFQYLKIRYSCDPYMNCAFWQIIPKMPTKVQNMFGLNLQ